MKPPVRSVDNADFLAHPFVAVPIDLIRHCGDLSLSPAEFAVLVQVIASVQTQEERFLTPADLAARCGLSPREAGDTVARLVQRNLLSIGERLESDGTRTNYYDLSPLWQALRGRQEAAVDPHVGPTDLFSLFEQEFGRPLSEFEFEQIRHWLDTDGHPQWLVMEALREAVLGNKFSFKYIDRILYDWQRHRVRTRQDLEAYRESYRERQQGREQVAASKPRPLQRKRGGNQATTRDERYEAFYHLFPDA
ncbi:DnaD domain-containing protein [Alicyclobacillus shizuokensis]|uniref:DnaD domain-containing protein n=1 Tax=Alicyclobacillus shizuokensis TaxID=392014 RepID=UPI000834C208|nr:DnaD domain protein [Alicyclobacillus shizuokensis]MCL6625415.1 DnaD domain protein [Alicyclobacillus shizuokensis]